jgi:hypothetical protein
MLASLSACSDIYYDRRETVALSADDHLNVNRVEQMVDPWPYYVGNKNLVFNGQRMQDAVERYRHDCVFPPPNPTTTASYITQQQQQMAQQQMARCQNQAVVPAAPPPPPIPAK